MLIFCDHGHVCFYALISCQVQSARIYWCRFLLFICSGSEPTGESVVQLIRQTGGVAVLAHPWALKNLVPVVKDLKAAGLHAMEVYRSDGKVSGMNTTIFLQILTSTDEFSLTHLCPQ